MQIDHDILLLLVGAGIGLSSSLLTSLFQAWLSKREFDRRRKQEKEEMLKSIMLPTTSEISQYTQISGDSNMSDKYVVVKVNRYFIFIHKLKDKLSYIPEFAETHFATYLFTISLTATLFGYLIYKALDLNLSPFLMSIIVAIVFFIFSRLPIKLIINKVISDAKIRFILAERAKLPKCPECGLPFVSDYERDQHIKRWHS